MMSINLTIQTRTNFYTYRLYQPVQESRSDAGSSLQRLQSERPVVRVGSLAPNFGQGRMDLPTNPSINLRSSSCAIASSWSGACW
jgi:hypothetical protein